MAAYSFEGINRLFSNDAMLPTLVRGPLLGLVGRAGPLGGFLPACRGSSAEITYQVI